MNTKRIWLKEIRKCRGMSQGDISKLIGLSRVYWAYLEGGQMEPSVRLAKKIADVLNFDWTRFYS